MAIKSLALVTAMVWPALLGMALPAAADSASGSDKPGDGDVYADIIRYSVGYGQTDVTVRAELLQSIDPSSWSDGTGISWDLDLDGGGEEEFTAHYSNPYFDEIGRVTDDEGEVVCVGRVSYDPANHSYTNTFPNSCIGSPEQFRVSTFMSWCGSNGSCYPPFDRAPDGGYSNAVLRPADAGQPPASGQTGNSEQTASPEDGSLAGGGMSPVKRSSSTSSPRSQPRATAEAESSDEESKSEDPAQPTEAQTTGPNSSNDRISAGDDPPAADRKKTLSVMAAAALLLATIIAVVSRRFGWAR